MISRTPDSPEDRVFAVYGSVIVARWYISRGYAAYATMLGSASLVAWVLGPPGVGLSLVFGLLALTTFGLRAYRRRRWRRIPFRYLARDLHGVRYPNARSSWATLVGLPVLVTGIGALSAPHTAADWGLLVGCALGVDLLVLPGVVLGAMAMRKREVLIDSFLAGHPGHVSAIADAAHDGASVELVVDRLEQVRFK